MLANTRFSTCVAKPNDSMTPLYFMGEHARMAGLTTRPALSTWYVAAVAIPRSLLTAGSPTPLICTAV